MSERSAASRRCSRGTLVVAATALLAASVILIPAASALPADAGDVRIAGDDRFGTAVELSQEAYADGAPVVYVANGMTYPDALVGAAAAGAEGSPVLLVARDAVPDATRTELERLAPERIVVLGGPAAVSDGVVAQLAPLAAEVVRRSGADRYETATLASAAAFDASTERVFVTVGDDFADALPAGAAAAATGASLLLVPTDRLPEGTATEIRRLQPSSIVVVGGRVSDAVVDELRPMADEVRRIAGATRYLTSVALSQLLFPDGTDTAYVSTGLSFADGLATGAVAATAPGPILLAPSVCLTSEVADELGRLGAGTVGVIGGTTALGRGIEERARCASRPGEAAALPCVAVPAASELHPFYRACVHLDGMLVAGSGKVRPAAIVEAARIARDMTAARPDVRGVLAQQGFFIGIMAVDEVTTDIPEHAHLADDPSTDWDERARGLGGNPTTAGEENALCLDDDRYRGESLVVHEFAHSFLDLGVGAAPGGADFLARVRSAYRAAMAEGLWTDTYAAENEHEYWAEVAQSWLDANLEADPPDGIHNHVDTREELESYDPRAAALAAEVLPSAYRYRCPGEG